MIIFSVCPACNAPVYDDPLEALFVKTGATYRRYECGAYLGFHDAPPVGVNILNTCPYAFRLAIQKAEAQPPSDYPLGSYWKLVARDDSPPPPREEKHDTDAI